MSTQQTVRHRHRFRTRLATGMLALSAFTASVAPSAWADPQPLAKAEAAIAANESSASTYTGPCSEACSGGGYGSGGQTRPSASSETQTTSLSEIQQGAEAAGLHPGVFGPTGATSIPATVVRMTAPNGGFHWGDAGIGAGGMLAVTLIGVGGLVAVTTRRAQRTRDEHAS